MRKRWMVPALAAVSLAIILLVGGLWSDDRVVSTATPTKTPVQDAAAESVPETETVTSDSGLTPTGLGGSLSPLSRTATPIPTFTPSPSAQAPQTETATPSAIFTVAPTWTATPIATFTAPPRPAGGTNAQEHYWLERPIPPAYTDWIDRNYPYGSTGGGILPTHHGVEFYNPVGVPALAAGGGVVVVAGSDRDVVLGPRADYYGNLVVIRHETLYQNQYVYTLYGHLSEVLVTEGTAVAAGDTVGLVGGTGVANGGAHLHFEVRVGANSYEATRNPELWLRPYSGRGTLAGRLLWPDGSYVHGAPLLVRRADDPTLFVNRTIYTYADASVNPDDSWRENWSTPDLEAGPYEVIFRQPERNLVIQQLIWVFPGETSMVNLTLPD